MADEGHQPEVKEVKEEEKKEEEKKEEEEEKKEEEAGGPFIMVEGEKISEDPFVVVEPPEISVESADPTEGGTDSMDAADENFLRLTHLTKNRPSAPKRRSTSTNSVRLLQGIGSLETVEVLKPSNEPDQPKRRPISVAGHWFGDPGASTLEAAQERDNDQVVQRKKMISTGNSNLSELAKDVKLRPASFHAGSKTETTDPTNLRDALRRKNNELKEMDKPFLQFKGKKRVIVSQIPKKTSYMNQGDTFILDTGLAIFVWNGEGATQLKKAKALEVAHRIRDKEYGAKVDMTVIDNSNASSPAAAPFWKKLGDASAIKTIEEGGDDAEFEKQHEENLYLFTFDPETGEKQQAGHGKEINKSMLKPSECAVLDCFSEIYVWVGRTTSDAAKAAANACAQELLKLPGRSPETILSNEEALKENTVFREKFPDWIEGGGNLSVKQQKNIEAKDWEHKVYDRGAFQRKVDKIDVERMAYPEVIAKEKELFDMKHDGVGTLMKVWYCQEREKSELDPKQARDLFSKESYVFLFEFMQKNREGPGERAVYVMYYWLGKDCKTGDKGVSALLAVEIDKMYGAPQVRIPHGKEPADFAAIFDSRLMIHDGSRDERVLKSPALYDVRGYSKKSVKAEQTTLDAANLNSAHCSLLSDPDAVYVWLGLGCFDYEEAAALEMAKDIADGRRIEKVIEGKETPQFWKAIGGKKDYCANELVKQNKKSFDFYKTKLYRCSYVKSGNPTAEEVENFQSKDLRQDGVFILDGYFELFVWVGEDSLSVVRDIRLAMETAMGYADLLLEKEDRLGKGPCTLIFQGHEPITFKGLFQCWENPAILREDGVTPPKKPNMTYEPRNVTEAWHKYIEATYTVDELKAEQIPFGVDAGNLELYLDDATFEKQVGISKDEYSSLPRWKQLEKKKGSGMF